MEGPAADGIDYTTTPLRPPIVGKKQDLYTVRLLERGGRKPKQWVFARQLEHLLWKTDANNGSLYHCLEEMNLDDFEHAPEEEEAAQKALGRNYALSGSQISPKLKEQLD